MDVTLTPTVAVSLLGEVKIIGDLKIKKCWACELLKKHCFFPQLCHRRVPESVVKMIMFWKVCTLVLLVSNLSDVRSVLL